MSRLFPMDLQEMKFAQFEATGYKAPVSGVVHRAKTSPALCGMPLGSIDTGCLDLETDGTFGYNTIFNSHVPRGGPMNVPFLGVSAGKESWVLSTKQYKADVLDAIPSMFHLKRAAPVDNIHYWGHFPVADLEYEFDAPISVGMRSWAPFFPGDSKGSNTPAIVFEVHVRNVSEQAQQGRLVISLPGPTPLEAHGQNGFKHRSVRDEISGVVVSNEHNVEYALGVIGDCDVMTGGAMGSDSGCWSRIAGGTWHDPDARFFTILPKPANGPGASVAKAYELEPGESTVVRFVLSWYAPKWDATGVPMGGGNQYTHMYASKFASSLDVANHIAENHEEMLSRIIAWQEAIYSDDDLPIWLRESLINVLYIMPETSFWAAKKDPVGDWCLEEDGIFALNESPRSCPQNECVPNTYLSNISCSYFFPDTVLSTLRAYKAYMSEEGQCAWTFGGCTACEGVLNRYDWYDEHAHTCEMTIPSFGYQTASNGASYAGLVDRYLQINPSQEITEEFYPSMKQNMIFTMNLRPAYNDGDRVLAMPTGNVDSEWFEHCEWAGMVTHVGGLRLAQLRMVKRMAEQVGDTDFAKQCADWIAAGEKSLEENLWDGECYLNFYEPETGKKSDLILSFQCDGQWMAHAHGLERVMPQDRVATVLSTVKAKGLDQHNIGTPTFMNRDGSAAANGSAEGMNQYETTDFFTSGCMNLAMTYMYEGMREEGLDVLYRCVENIVLRQRLSWDSPVLMDSENGRRTSGSDYTQIMTLWAVPAALKGQDSAGLCGEGGLVARVLAAANPRKPAAMSV
ncbi:MAG: hypothetical protein CMJ19_01550 [Phycisphaeraceae bacterium]|nr:hypothetical protein [Phycisphaeraceae bacterium]